jgi:sugar O-acyltransferase (sialic acid O-acetyltransferase NeuD family)
MANGAKVILVGGFIEMIELCIACGAEIIGIVAPNKESCFGYPFLGTDNDAAAIRDQFGNSPVVLTPDSPSVRERLRNLYSGMGFPSCNLVHPNAAVSPSALLGAGVVIQQGAHVSALASIGNDVKLNIRANVMHEVVVGDLSTIAPNAVILGRVQVGKGVYIGANATVLPGLRLGDGAVVGAGAVVTRDVPPHTTVKGNPAR